ncbi:inositol polyphosphate kinase domain-containing protein [Ditylenchus destructor]|uniref:Kinase n=1 Tax=Ditylenchus destructor TaxID=166010 RepID=A0AAD4N0Q3_9BILA|nr:inositol polyphosphate kinase domain-containing protein [Ditylenchus destructor]
MKAAAKCDASKSCSYLTTPPLNCQHHKNRCRHTKGDIRALARGSTRKILKKLPDGANNEVAAYSKISQDGALRGIMPKFIREIEYKGDCFIESEDLLWRYPNPKERYIIDVKLGTRLVSENGRRRPTAPTEQERRDESINKLRYMKFREEQSSTSTLGFRIDVAKLPSGKLQKDLKRHIKTKEQVLEEILGGQKWAVRKQLRQRLMTIRAGVENSQFFQSHEVVGGSLLIVFDSFVADAWLIDFAKVTKVPDGVVLNHHPNTDGYLTGLDSLIEIFQSYQ